MDLLSATQEEIQTHYGLYSEMIRIMTAVDGEAPYGSCCGRNKEKHCKQFVENREKYIKRMEAIKNRKIQPKWRGTVFFSKLGRHYSSETITDEESIEIIKTNKIKDLGRYFIVPDEIIKEIEKMSQDSTERILEEDKDAPKTEEEKVEETTEETVEETTGEAVEEAPKKRGRKKIQR